MKKIKKISCIAISLCIIFSCCCFTSFAAEETDSTISIVATSNKNSYSTIGTAKITVTIENTSTKTINNINVAATFNETSPIGSGNPYAIGLNLEPGEKQSFSFNSTISSQKLNFFWSFILTLKRFFSNAPRTVDINNISAISSSSLSLNFGGNEVTETVWVWCAESKDVYLTPRNKSEAIEFENRRHENELSEIENNYDISLEYLNIRETALKQQYGTSSFLSASYYLERINELDSEISELQRRINALQYDNSASATRKRLEYIAEKEDLEADRDRYNDLLTASYMFEQIDNEKDSAKTKRDNAIAKENTLHQNNIAEIERKY